MPWDMPPAPFGSERHSERHSPATPAASTSHTVESAKLSAAVARSPRCVEQRSCFRPRRRSKQAVIAGKGASASERLRAPSKTMADEKLPRFSLAVKDTKQIDHLVFKAADLDTKTTAWKVEIHDQSWPHIKTLTYEVKKLTKLSDWDTLTVRIRPQKEGRMLAWRATYVAGSVQGAWSPDWTPVVPADERQRDLDTGNKKWEKIFAPYVPYVPAPPGRPYVPVMAHGC